jgi:cytochrome P450
MATLGNVIVYDASDPRWSTDPVPLFEEIRAENPVHRATQGFWVLSRHRDCLAILRSRRSSSDSTNLSTENQPQGLRDLEQRPDVVSQVTSTPGADARPFLFRDPPDHTRLRGLVAKAFTPKMVNELTPFITQRADAYLDQCFEAGTLDLQEGLCYPLPIAVITELLGIPESDHLLFRGWSEALARGLDPDFLLPPEVLEARNTALFEFASYFFALLEDRKRNPGSDLLSALAVAEEEGDTLSEVEMLSTSILLLVAGHETTVNLLTGSVIELSQRPDVCRKLTETPSLWRTAIEELMRLVAPVQFTGRTLLDDVRIGDVIIPGGSFAMLLVASANRDPEIFEHPMELLVDRDPNPQLGFGFGLHHCLGAPLARLEARITLARLMERAKSFEVAGPITYRPNIVLRGVTSLPVTLKAH